MFSLEEYVIVSLGLMQRKMWFSLYTLEYDYINHILRYVCLYKCLFIT